jgi:hypothetical protein
MVDDKLEDKIEQIKDSLHDLDKNVAIISHDLKSHTDKDEQSLIKINTALNEIDKRLDKYNC